MEFDEIPEAINAIKQGEFVVVLDDEDRENEGDLIIAALCITTEQMAFMIRYTSGFICVPMNNDLADKLHLPLMVPEELSTDRCGTACTVTVDAAQNTTTGISAHDRALTCRLLADEKARPQDFLRPGHVVPLRARDGGVLRRRGHTEAAVDLCRLAGLNPVGALCEIVNDDGTMARTTDCIRFAALHGFKIITIEHLVRYLKENPSF